MNETTTQETGNALAGRDSSGLLNCGGLPVKFSEGERARIQWEEGCSVVSPECTLTKVRKLFVVVEFDSEPGAGLDKTQKFTLRKSGKWIAAEWHWVIGIPELVAI